MAIKAAISLKNPPDRDWFTSLDAIEGSIDIATTKSVDVRDILVFLEGKRSHAGIQAKLMFRRSDRPSDFWRFA